MLYLGTIQNLNLTPGMQVLNFTSLNEKYPRLDILPPYEMGARSEYDFDVKYAQWIFANDNVFFEFMQIPYNIYLGKDVWILICDDEAFDMINQSLEKLIQQRYGINGAMVTCLDDFLYAGTCEFSEIGIINFRMDKERLAMMLEKNRIASGGYLNDVK